jgi:chromate transport protein ChrA
LGIMRLIAVLLAGALTYAVVLLVLSEAMAVADESPWYWLPFVASLAAVVVVSAPWRSWHSANRKTTIAAVCLLAVLVLAIDLAGAVWYSCSKGVCL